MRKGVNRAFDIHWKGRIANDPYKGAYLNPTLNEDIPCVFISHKQEDTEACVPIAEYLKDAGVDIYFDKNDPVIAEIVQEGNPDKLTQHLQAGIDKSSHMICVVSPTTLYSYWVPFEVGYGCKAEIGLGVLTLKGISDADLPDYMRTTRVIRGTQSFNQFIADLLGESKRHLEERDILKKSTQMRHPLDKILDWEN